MILDFIVHVKPSENSKTDPENVRMPQFTAHKNDQSMQEYGNKRLLNNIESSHLKQHIQKLKIWLDYISLIKKYRPSMLHSI